MASNSDIPLEGSSVDAPKETEEEKTPELCKAEKKEIEDSSVPTTSEPVEACTEAQIQSILKAAGQDMQEDEEEDSKNTELEKVDFTVVWNKKKYEVSFPLDHTVGKLRQHIQSLTGVPVSLQKIMYKGLVKDDDMSLRVLKVVNGAKMMVVGSTLNDVVSMSAPAAAEIKAEEKAEAKSKEALSEQKNHKKVLDKYGKPDDVSVGIKNVKEPLPQFPISGMYNKAGGKVRLTFKMEADQLWIGTKERTEKIPMGSIKNVVSEAILGHENYHLMAVQLGPTEASRYWVYWVPAQYVDAIKDTVLGKFPF